MRQSSIVNAADRLTERLRGCSWSNFTREEQIAIRDMIDTLARTAPPSRDARPGQTFRINPIELLIEIGE